MFQPHAPRDFFLHLSEKSPNIPSSRPEKMELVLSVYCSVQETLEYILSSQRASLSEPLHIPPF